MAMEEELTTAAPPTDGPPWPCAWPGPPIDPLDRAELWELRGGDVEADRLEAALATAARSRGALDLAVGDGLAAMRVGDRLIRLGFSCLGDYAREVLGIQERTAQNLAHLSRELRCRPLLRAAVRAGTVRIRKAQTVLPVAVGDAEAEWVEAARSFTVDTLEGMVRTARSAPGQEERWRRLRVGLEPEERAVLDEALAAAGQVIGGGAGRAERLEALAQEYVGEHPVEAGEDLEQPAAAVWTARECRERCRAELEVETQQWAHLAIAPEPPAPDGPFDETASAEEVDTELRNLAHMRETWDAVVGPCGLAVQDSGLHHLLGFADFPHYCSERLGLSTRSVEQRVALERRLWEVPVLREAFLDRRLSYEKVRLLSRLPDADIPAWIPRAAGLTCIELRRALAAEEEAQLRAARAVSAPVPLRVALLLAAAFRAVRAVENPHWSDGKCLVAIAHFLDTWKPLVKRQRTRSQRIRERDLGNCQVPMCSRRAAHAHHVKPRGQLGPDVDENLVGICASHHLRGIHGGYIRVSGTAPGGLVWELVGKVWMGPEPWVDPGQQA